MAFQKGESGNPAGRPRGARNRRTLLAEHLLEGDTEAIVRTMIERAKEGDMAAVRLCVDRICPRVTDRPAGFELPPLVRAADAPPAIAAIAQALADGDLTAAEAADLGRFVESFARAFEKADIEKRLAGLEMREKKPNARPPAVSMLPWTPPPAVPPAVDSTAPEPHIDAAPPSLAVAPTAPE
jgi:hypothetical protein